MKVPYNWIKDYVDIDVTPKELGDMLTLTGSQLEEVIIQGMQLKKGSSMSNRKNRKAS